MASELGVQTIQHTNGTDAMTIDSTGRVLQPAKPAFSVYLLTQANSQNFTGGDAVIPFDSKDFDIGSNVVVGSSAVFTAPVAGVYQFNLEVSLGDVEAATWSSSYLFIDGAKVSASSNLSYRNLDDPQGGQYQALSSSHLIQLSASQTVTPYIRMAGDTSISVRTGTRFSGFLVG